MGAKTMMLVVADGDVTSLLASKPTLDREATVRLLGEFFPNESFVPLGEGSLADTYPEKDEIYVGHFGAATIVTAWDFGLDRPSQLDERFLRIAGSRTVLLHTMHSVVDFFAYGIWREGKLVRSFSLTPDDGIMEEIGERMAFEVPYWAGEHPVDDPADLADPDYEPYPFPFHPLDMGEAALREFFGFQIEGIFDPNLLRPGTVQMLRFRRA